jgi:predicted PurR-regulated permease PerM
MAHHIMASQLRVGTLTQKASKTMAVLLLAGIAAILIALAIVGLTAFFGDQAQNVVELMRKMADTVETARNHVPEWAIPYVPATTQEWQSAASGWLRDHAGEMQRLGEGFGRFLTYILIGSIIGGLAALGEATPRTETMPPLKRALNERAQLLGNAFRRVVFAQVRISALNTALTAIYLALLLPMMGVELPLIKTMIVVTFVAGLLPVLGNLISNTVIVIVSLSVSHYAAMGSLIYLVLIHKLEYFVNARIIGGQINARAWEMLFAMLVMEAAFGLPGLVAAPIYYAYLKDELMARKLI